MSGMIAKDDGRVPQQATPFGSPERCVAKPCAKRIVIQLKQSSQFNRVVLRQRLELRLPIGLGVRIPGAYLLADVATEEPIAEPRPQLGRNRVRDSSIVK